MDLKKLLDSLTLQEKIGQLTQLNANFLQKDITAEITGPEAHMGLSDEQISKVGSVLNFQDISEAKALIEAFSKQGKIPLLLMLDVIHGYRTIYPIPLAMACSFDMDLIKRCSQMAAKEAAVSGIHVNFSPMVDMVRDARWGRVMESGGEDVYLSSQISTAQVEGFQGDLGKYDVVACVKHFAGYGGAEAGRDYNTVDISEKTLHEHYLPTYKAAIDAGVKMVMTSFNTLNGVPMAGNKQLVSGLLREEWGFDGVIISDYNAFREMVSHGYCKDDKQAAFKALDATNDIEMMSPTYFLHLEELLNEGKISIEQIDKAVMRVLKLKQELGLFENPLRALSEEEFEKFVLCDNHRNIAREGAEKSAVLLKNDNLLPFSDTVKSIAVIGDYADNGDIIGFWHCGGRAEETTTVYAGVKNLLPNAVVKKAKGCSMAVDALSRDGFNEAVELAKNSEIVILTMGEPAGDSGEGNSKMNIEIPNIQYELLQEILKVNKNVAVVLFSGRPLAIEKLDGMAPAILHAWQPGTEGGSAIANLLFGKAVPQGKLAMTFPRSTGQCPIYYNAYNTGRPRGDDKNRVWYQSSYLDGPNSPLYPFGYGLSYANFEYSPVSLDKTQISKGQEITASVTIKNLSDITATETVQLYLCDRFASCVRPVRELKGFKKVTLKAGETKKVEFKITEKMLEFLHVDLTVYAEEGEFLVAIGGDSLAKFTATFELV